MDGKPNAPGTVMARAEDVRAQIHSILLAWGMAADLAETTTDAMVETDLLGVDSHGISMLMGYETHWRAGKLDLTARPKVVRETPCMALLDAGAGLGHPVSTMAMTMAVDKALQVGMAVVGVRNSHHFGAAGVYARIAARRGAIGMVTSATRGVAMVPTNAGVPVLGTNPIAFAAPTQRNLPFVLDMATTTVASGKVKVYHLNDKPLPDGWVVDGQGRSITDPHEAHRQVTARPEGGITPLGGTADMASHKGYGLAMMAHILGGTLTGASFSPIRNRTQTGTAPDDLGHFFMAIDPRAFRDEGAFEADLNDVIDELHATPPAQPGGKVLVAGDPEEAARIRRLKDGIPIPAMLGAQLREICDRCGVPFLLG
ncbi:LDH2 family malate/lactate/ureidoglycolate dehydrogenase [Humitalea rosea]|uniref:LDH2 family malate/lactate/ureidoglycolate dehydrogenase n=1 Tax=Humitalea rosea TaxID=990373 RepID=A0A2W7IM09_9PROT|nr:Ldh family oxidoreductase [Humitalea rosea]PZW48097.1 LDH2 family malate/lactate/ureidoglycolate dehydrogenase [Humitalea rosea]